MFAMTIIVEERPCFLNASHNNAMQPTANSVAFMRELAADPVAWAADGPALDIYRC